MKSFGCYENSLRNLGCTNHIHPQLHDHLHPHSDPHHLHTLTRTLTHSLTHSRRTNHLCKHGPTWHRVRLQWGGNQHRVETGNQLRWQSLQRGYMLWYVLYWFWWWWECNGCVACLRSANEMFVLERPRTCADTTGVGDSGDKLPIDCSDEGPNARLSAAHCADLSGGCSVTACCGTLLTQSPTRRHVSGFGPSSPRFLTLLRLTHALRRLHVDIFITFMCTIKPPLLSLIVPFFLLLTVARCSHGLPVHHLLPVTLVNS